VCASPIIPVETQTAPRRISLDDLSFEFKQFDQKPVGREYLEHSSERFIGDTSLNQRRIDQTQVFLNLF